MVKQAAGYSLQLPVATYNTKTQTSPSLTPSSVKHTLDLRGHKSCVVAPIDGCRHISCVLTSSSAKVAVMSVHCCWCCCDGLMHCVNRPCMFASTSSLKPQDIASASDISQEPMTALA